ncbi:MAG: hypothetical protein NVS3B3_11350 [Aquirhabdus sp.]
MSSMIHFIQNYVKCTQSLYRTYWQTNILLARNMGLRRIDPDKVAVMLTYRSLTEITHGSNCLPRA